MSAESSIEILSTEDQLATLPKTDDMAEAPLMAEETAPPIPSAPSPCACACACTRSHRLSNQVSYSACFQSLETLEHLVVLDSASASRAYTLNLYICAPGREMYPQLTAGIDSATSNRVFKGICTIMTSNLMSLKWRAGVYQQR
jgi:hypothetical protein